METVKGITGGSSGLEFPMKCNQLIDGRGEQRWADKVGNWSTDGEVSVVGRVRGGRWRV